MKEKDVMMRVPKEFRELIRRKAGKKDKSMKKYLEEFAKNFDEEKPKENKKFDFRF